MTFQLQLGATHTSKSFYYNMDGIAITNLPRLHIRAWLEEWEANLESGEHQTTSHINIELRDQSYPSDGSFLFRIPSHWMIDPEKAMQKLIEMAYQNYPNKAEKVPGAEETWFYLGAPDKSQIPSEENHRHKISLTTLNRALKNILDEEYWQIVLVMYC